MAQGAASAPLTISADGETVIDAQAGVAWSRCVEGMHWTGKTCEGEAVLATHKEALSLAADRRKADGGDWRLPRVTALRQLASDMQALRDGGRSRFPRAPEGWYWAGSANVDSTAPVVNQYNYGNLSQGRNSENTNRMAFLHGWAVDMATGEARGDFLKRTTRLPVRLMRLLSVEKKCKQDCQRPDILRY
ncbi:MAG: DUF1566 domain-containing protein [Aquabacterium sp.]|nr:MAG: DUF1566 domain-containing protein [Aquabacterium sp.]